MWFQKLLRRCGCAAGQPSGLTSLPNAAASSRPPARAPSSAPRPLPSTHQCTSLPATQGSPSAWPRTPSAPRPGRIRPRKSRCRCHCRGGSPCGSGRAGKMGQAQPSSPAAARSVERASWMWPAPPAAGNQCPARGLSHAPAPWPTRLAGRQIQTLCTRNGGTRPQPAPRAAPEEHGGAGGGRRRQYALIAAIPLVWAVAGAVLCAHGIPRQLGLGEGGLPALGGALQVCGRAKEGREGVRAPCERWRRPAGSA